MKKFIPIIACLLLFGCTEQAPVEEELTKIVYAAAQYCPDDDCSVKALKRYDEEEIHAILTFLDELPNITTSAKGQVEKAKLVMIDEKGYQHVYREMVEYHPSGEDYTLNKQGQRISFNLNKDQRLTTLLQGLEGISDDVKMGYERLPQESFFVSSYQGYSQDIGNSVNKKAFEMLFYINESFTDVQQIKDQKLLLSGLLKQAQGQYETTYVFNNQLMIIDAVVDQYAVEALGNSRIVNYQLPNLSTSQIGAFDNNHFYYDANNHQFIMDKNYYLSNVDWLLMPIYEDGDQVRVARFKVYREATQYGACYEMLLNHTYSEKVCSYEGLYDQLVVHLDQVDLFDVVTDSEGRLTRVEVVQLTQQNDTPITKASFIDSKVGESNLYTLSSQSVDAIIYNDFIKDRFLYTPQIRSSLYETDDLISVEIISNAYGVPTHCRIFFDKASGRLISEAMINQRYYEGQLVEKVVKQLNEQGLSACPLGYMEGLAVERCYVQPILDEVAAPFNFFVPYAKLKINDHQLVVPVIIKSKGSYQETLEIIP